MDAWPGPAEGVAVGPGSEDDLDLSPGDRVGDFVIVRRIGSGSTGVVYEALDPALGRPVGIKVLGRVYAESSVVVRFAAEARILSAIRHPGVVAVLACGQLPDRRPYLVMEHLDGPTLRQYAADRDRIDLREVLDILGALAHALDAVHARGITHRDVKPANVILLREGDRLSPRLLDFGLARSARAEPGLSLTTTGALMGTPGYMAPEQARGAPVDARADAYAFGVIAYELLTGSSPFTAGDPLELMMQHRMRPVPPASRRNEALPQAVDAVLGQLLARGSRPASSVAGPRRGATGARADLAASSSAAPPADRWPSGADPRRHHPCRRQRSAAPAAARSGANGHVATGG